MVDRSGVRLTDLGTGKNYTVPSWLEALKIVTKLADLELLQRLKRAYKTEAML